MATVATARCSGTRRAASNSSYIPGFYRALNSQTSAITDCPLRTKPKLCLSLPQDTGIPQGLLPSCYLVERVIAARRNKRNCEYPVLWESYPKEEASWVNKEDITSAAIRSFESPTPPFRAISDATSDFITALQKSLKFGVNKNNRFDLEFRTDVFVFLFESFDRKGRNPPKGRGLFYDINDFDKTYFKDWYIAYDKLGDGCSVDFPIRLKSKIRWSHKVFNSDGMYYKT